MAKIAKFFQPGTNRGRDQQVAMIAEREARYDNATSATVAAMRGEWDAEGRRIEKLAEELGLQPFDHPLREIDAKLARAEEVARAKIDMLALERALGGFHTPGQGLTAPLSDQKKKDFTARLEALKVKVGEPAGEPTKRPEGALPEAVERALLVADSQPAPARTTPEKQRAQLDEALDELAAGRAELVALIEDARKEASHEACLRAQKRHDALLTEIYMAAQRLAAAAAQEQTFRMVFPTLGLTARSDILPMPGQLMQAILTLGSDVDYGSALSEYRRFLESRDLLK